MINLNWRDASKELPSSDYSCNDLLLIIENKHIKTGNYKAPRKCGDIVFDDGFYQWNDDYGMYEDFFINREVTGWLPISEIPLPLTEE